MAQGTASEVITRHVAREVFGLEAYVGVDPVSGTPMVVPTSRNVGRASGCAGSLGASRSAAGR